MLQVGFGVGDITPAVGMEMPGGFFKRNGTGVRDKLLAVACVLHDGARTVALVGIDTLFITRSTVEVARRIVVKETKVPFDNVLIGANHTHSGGPIASCLGCDEDPTYVEKVAKGIAAAVRQGWTTLHASEVAIGAGQVPGIAYNRRFAMRDGREITHPGKPGTPHNKDIVEVAGPVDPEVGVLAVREPGPRGKMRGLVVHFGCHSTVVGGSEFSPDYAGYLRKHLQGHYGASVPVCFLLGPCGDVTQVDNQAPGSDFGVEHADMMGLKLAGESIRTVRKLTWLREAPVNALTERVPVSIRPDPDAVRERPAYGLGSDNSKERKVDAVYAAERKLVAAERARQPIVTCEVQAIRVGPLGIATNGAEYFAEYGLRIKKASRFANTWVVELANEWIGYVPTAQAFVGGGYEPRTARSSKLAIDGGQRLLEGALKALGRVAPAVKE